MSINDRQAHELVSMPLGGEIILLAQALEGFWVPMRGLCERFGLNYRYQRERMLRDGWRYGTRLLSVHLASGATAEQACIPAARLPLWVWLLGKTSRERIGPRWLRLLTAEWEEALIAFYVGQGAVLPRYMAPMALIEQAAAAAREAERWREQAQCGAADRAAQAEMTRLRDDCARLEQQLKERQRRIETLDGRLRRLETGAPTISDKMAALAGHRWGERRQPCETANYRQTDWWAALHAAVQTRAGGRTGVAELLGVSRPMVSLVISGRYGASTARIEREVRAKLMTSPAPDAQECSGAGV